MAYKKGSIETKKNARATNRAKKPHGYIYILRYGATDIYKIGVSANPKRRISDLDKASPFPLRCVFLKFFQNVYNIEECVHNSFNTTYIRHEWFKIHKDDLIELRETLTEWSERGMTLIRRAS